MDNDDRIITDKNGNRVLDAKPGDKLRFKQNGSGFKRGDIVTVEREAEYSSPGYRLFHLVRDSDGHDTGSWSTPANWFDFVSVEVSLTPEEVASAESFKSHQELGEFLGL